MGQQWKLKLQQLLVRLQHAHGCSVNRLDNPGRTKHCQFCTSLAR